VFARGLAIFATVAGVAVGLAGCAPTPEALAPQASVSIPLREIPTGMPERSGPALSFAIRDAAALRKEYGKPDFVRSEANSEMWRYDGANCALFLFLYREQDSFQLRHMETLPRGAQSATDEACLASVKARFTPAS
jgi:hypothetical protein